MTAIFDTLRAAQQLADHGLTEEQATAIVSVFSDMRDAELATKSDLKELEHALKTDIAELRAEVNHEIGALRAEVNHEIGALRAEIKEMELRITMRLGGMIAVAVALITLFQQIL